MKNIIIVTHAGLARGFKEAAEFIAGASNISAICAFTEETDPEGSFEAILSRIGPEDKTIVFTDIGFGSVNRLIAKKLAAGNFYLITGVNLPILLELALANEEDINDGFIKEAVEKSKEEMYFMNERVDLSQKKEDDDFFS